MTRIPGLFLLTFSDIGAIIISKYKWGCAMGILDIFKKKTTLERIISSRVNCSGESVDCLDKDGNLPFGWVVYNKNYVDMIENDMQPFRKAIRDAKTDNEKYGALKSFLLYLQDGKVHYKEYGECVGKYFEEYICKSAEAEQTKKKYKELEKKLKDQK